MIFSGKNVSINLAENKLNKNAFEWTKQQWNEKHFKVLSTI